MNRITLILASLLIIFVNLSLAQSTLSSLGYDDVSQTVQCSVIDDVISNCEGSVTALPSGGTPTYSYLWDDPASQTTATAIDLCKGLYKVKLSDGNGCFLNHTLIVYNTVGVESSYFEDNIIISPNPSNTGVFNIDFSDNIKSNIKIIVYNSLGEIIFNDGVNIQNINNKKIDLSPYAHGIYFLQIGESKVFKLVYQK